VNDIITRKKVIKFKKIDVDITTSSARVKPEDDDGGNYNCDLTFGNGAQ